MRPIKLFRTASFRLTVLYAGLFIVSVVVLFGLATWFAVEHATQDEVNEIASEYVTFNEEIAAQGYERLPTIMGDHARRRAALNPIYLLEAPDGRKLAGNIGPLALKLGPQRVMVDLAGTKIDVRAHGYLLTNGDYFLIGQQTPVLREMETLIFRTFGYGIALTFTLALLGGLVVSMTLLRHVEAVSQTAQAIVGQDLSKRVAVRGTDDEFDHLAASINDMLDRIEALMQNVRQVSNDIAHDLRTPLTRMRHRLEDALDEEATPEQLRNVIASSVSELDCTLETFAALLRIAQIESGIPQREQASVDVSSLLSVLVDDYAPLAMDGGKRLTSEVEPGLTTGGDPELLTQMVVNLIDNAIRHSSPGAHIVVEGKLQKGSVEIAVADNGPGIPLDEHQSVLKPFYRLDVSRSTPGNGLGLSLVAAIVKRHHATLSLADNHPGLRIAVALAASTSESVGLGRGIFREYQAHPARSI